MRFIESEALAGSVKRFLDREIDSICWRGNRRNQRKTSVLRGRLCCIYCVVVPAIAQWHGAHKLEIAFINIMSRREM